jgi:hypothetical protein
MPRVLVLVVVSVAISIAVSVLAATLVKIVPRFLEGEEQPEEGVEP